MSSKTAIPATLANEKRAPATRLRSRLFRLFPSAGILGLALILPRCSAPSPNYGIGNNLQARTPPSASGAGAASSVPPGILDASCADTGTCSVSWSDDIFPNMESTGPWQCASASCHGGPTTPVIRDGDPSGAYASLATHAGTYSNPYIVPCNTNAAHCSIVCNLTPNGCGSTMPIGSTATPLNAADLSMIQTWVACGSPLN